MLNYNLNNIIVKETRRLVEDPDLVIAISGVESNWNTMAMRYEPKWKYFYRPEVYAKKLYITQDTEKQLQMFSYGICQIMGSVARELGFDGPLPQLLVPEFGIEFSVKKIIALRKKYPDLGDIISSYNQGSPRKNPDGSYVNQAYVDKVMKNLMQLKEK